MARPMTTTLSEVGVSTALPIDLNVTPVNVSLAVTLSPGAVLTYTIEHTYDEIVSSDPTPDAIWFPFITNVDKNSDGFYAYPVIAVRIKITSYTSGVATLRVVQAGN